MHDAVLDPVDPAVNGERLATRPGVLDDRRTRHVVKLVQHVEFHQPRLAGVGIGDQVELPLVQVVDVLDVAQPVVDQPVLLALHGAADAAAAIVAAHDDMLHTQHADRVLQHRQAVDVGVHDEVGDVAVHEHRARVEIDDLGRRAPGCPSSRSTGISAPAGPRGARRTPDPARRTRSAQARLRVSSSSTVCRSWRLPLRRLGAVCERSTRCSHRMDLRSLTTRSSNLDRAGRRSRRHPVFTSGTTQPTQRLRGKLPVRSAIGATCTGAPASGIRATMRLNHLRSVATTRGRDPEFGAGVEPRSRAVPRATRRSRPPWHAASAARPQACTSCAPGRTAGCTRC